MLTKLALNKTSLEKSNAINNVQRTVNNSSMNLNQLGADTISFKMSYTLGLYGSSDRNNPEITDDTIKIKTGVSANINVDKDNNSNKSIVMSPESKLSINTSRGGGALALIKSLQMGESSYISSVNGSLIIMLPSSIEDNCKIDAKKIECRDTATIGNNFTSATISSRKDLTVGNSLKATEISSSGNINIGDSAQAESIFAVKDIKIGENFQPVSNKVRIYSTEGSINIGRKIVCETKNFDEYKSPIKCRIETIETPKVMKLEYQNDPDAIDTIKAGSILIGGSATVKKVYLQDSILKNPANPTKLLTVLKDVIVSKSSNSAEQKGRSVTIQNTVINEDLIIQESSDVKEINLDNVTIHGRLVLEDPSVKVIQNNSSIKKILRSL